MAYTKFGEFMRIQRIKNHEVMGDSAKLLGVTLPFMSSVENGKKNIPESWFIIISEHYNLNSVEQKELIDAIENSKVKVKIDLSDTQSYQRNVAIQFQRSFDDIDEETAEKILQLLGGNAD